MTIGLWGKSKIQIRGDRQCGEIKSKKKGGNQRGLNYSFHASVSIFLREGVNAGFQDHSIF